MASAHLAMSPGPPHTSQKLLQRRDFPRAPSSGPEHLLSSSYLVGRHHAGGLLFAYRSMRGRLSLTSQMETRDDRNLWRIVSRRITVRRGPSLHSARGVSEQAVWSRPICPTLCVTFWTSGV